MSITPAQLQILEAAAQHAQDGAVRADDLAAGIAWWADSSTKAAARADALASHTLADVLATKLRNWRLSATPVTDDAVIDFARSANYAADTSTLEHTADVNSWGGMLSGVAHDSAQDVANAAKGAVPWIAVAAGAALFGFLAYVSRR